MTEPRGCEVHVTESGALAIRDRATGECMHPYVGPLREALELYVTPSKLEARLDVSSSRDPLVLLDVGLGAGSNAIAAWKISERLATTARPLTILSFDHTTEALALATSADHASAFGFEGAAHDAARALLHHGRFVTPRSDWSFVSGDLPSTLAHVADRSADVVFWDPYSPRANPSLWSYAAFAALHRCCREGATLHTYSAATSTRSALFLAGFAVGEGSGTHDGKATTVAAMNARDLERPLERRWLERLARSSLPFPADAPKDAFAVVASRSQFAST